jgi:hypothetical protein
MSIVTPLPASSSAAPISVSTASDLGGATVIPTEPSFSNLWLKMKGTEIKTRERKFALYLFS